MAEENLEKLKEHETETNKQRNFLIKTVRDFLSIEVSDEEICALLFSLYGNHINSLHSHIPISFYLKKEDENMLFERKVYNRYAKCNEIRYEDSYQIIHNFLSKIKSKDQLNQINHINKRVIVEPKGSLKDYIYRPLFC